MSSRPKPRGSIPRRRAESPAEIADVLRAAGVDWDSHDLDGWLDTVGHASAAQGLPRQPRPLLPLVTAMTSWRRDTCDHAIERFTRQLTESGAHGIRNPWAVLVDIFVNGNDGYFPGRPAALDRSNASAVAAALPPVDFAALVAPDLGTAKEEAAGRQIGEWEADPVEHERELAHVDQLLDDLRHEAPLVFGAIRHLSRRHQREVALARSLDRTVDLLGPVGPGAGDAR